MTNKELIRKLNEVGPPDNDHPENGGRVSWKMVNRYGEWMYRNDRIAFIVLKQELEKGEVLFCNDKATTEKKI